MKKKFLRNILPLLLGALGGFLYYTFIGCNSGTCPITGNPYISTLYGVLIGFTFTDFLNFKKKKGENEQIRMKYGFSKTIKIPFEQAVEKVTEELKKEGFGVLTTIDVKETLKKKIDVDFKKYLILGACNPALAHKALQSEEELGLLLPCNVILYEKNGDTVVSVFNPDVMTEVIHNENLKPVAQEVKERLGRFLEAV